MSKFLPSKKLISCMLLVGLMAVNYFAQTSGSGQTGTYTGAPNESDCTSCHGGTNLQTSGTNWNNLLLDNGTGSGVADYIPDSLYTMTLSYKEGGKSKFGFELTVLDSVNKKMAGTLVVSNSTYTQKFTTNVNGSSRSYILHKSAGTAGNGGVISWKISWKAPSTNVGKVFFYVTLNSTNSSGTDAGDVIYAKKFAFLPSDSLPTASISLPSKTICVGDTLYAKGTGNMSPTKWSWSFANGVPVSPSSSSNQDEKFVYSSLGTFKMYLQTTNDKGKSLLDSASVTVNSKPTITISTTSNQSFCEGDSAVLTSKYPPGCKVLWSTGDTTDNITVTQSGDYTCTATNAAGCSKTSSAISITVIPRPKVSISASSQTTLCSTDTFFVSASPSGLSNYSFVVNGSAVNNGTSNNYNIPYSGTSNYLVVALADTAGCLSDTSNSLSLTFKTKVAAPNIVCDNNTNSSISFKWQSVTNATGYQVSEDSGATWITPSSGSTGLTHKVDNLPNNIYLKLLIRATDNAPCNLSDEASVVCHTGSCTPISYNLNNYKSSICPGDSSVLDISFTNSGKYGISLDGGAVSSKTTYVFKPKQKTTYAFDLTDSSQLGCPATSFKIDVDITPPLSNITIQSNNANNTWCPTEAAKFTSPSVTGYSYEFFVNGVSVQKGSQNEYTSTSLKDGDKVKVTATNAGGCEGTSSEITVTIKSGLSNITIQSNSNTNTWCNGQSATFTSPSVSGYTYDFFVNAVSVQKGSQNDYTSNTLVTGDKVKVTAYSAAGCSGTSSEITSTITPGPVAKPFKYVSNAQGVTFNFNDTVIANSLYIHSWNFGDGKTGSGSVVNHTYAQNGTYTVWMIIKNGGCSDSISTQITARNTGIANSEMEGELNIWPNPFTNELNISWSSDTKPVLMELNDMQGSKILTVSQSTINNVSSTTLATDNLPSGVYWLKIVMQNGQTVKRIIKL